MRVLLQFPEGLKQKAIELAQKYEHGGHSVFLSASPCYGACDIALDEARWIKADKIVHFGHNKFMKSELEIPVEYVPYTIDIDTNTLHLLIPHLHGKKTIALVTTVQHAHQIPQMKAFFAAQGFTVLTETGYWATQHGQILGCDALGVKKLDPRVDAVVYVGDGMFHPLGIESTKPIFAFNPYTQQVRPMNAEIERLQKKRKGSLAAAVTANRFAILVSTKVGQFNLHGAEWAKKELHARGREAAILVANELDPISLNNFRSFDCYVNTACPRIVDDTIEFGKPILSIELLKELFQLLDAHLEKNKNEK
jgi:2-(3-amino-3-carboxypropyl)histidine synthase